MPEAVIVSTARTPIGKAYRGSLIDTNGSTLAAHVIRAAAERAGVALGEIDDVMLGSAHPEGATGNNVARVAAIEAGCPASVPGMTLDRKCSSGLQAVVTTAQNILLGDCDYGIGGGVEVMSRAGYMSSAMRCRRLRWRRSVFALARRAFMLRAGSIASRWSCPTRI